MIMKTFKEYIAEAATRMSSVNGVVASFARMQPVTVGHGLLVKKVIETAQLHKCNHIIYLSKTQDKKNNPLDIETKLKWARLIFPGANIVGATDQIRTFIEMVKDLNKKYKVLYLVAGSDRVQEYKLLLDKYNGLEYHYDNIEVVSAGVRDPDADGSSGMSATKMRSAAKNNDLAAFKHGLPDHIHNKAVEMMNDVRVGMAVH